ncbi:MAG: hypothetical protein NXI30_17315 [bacterium]|nr:hypothetical protein [bacterium]
MTNDNHDRRHGSCGGGARRRGRDGGRSRRREREGREGPRSQRRERKEKVLHTRISEQLADDIRRFAEEVRVPASNLVRNVLEEVFTVADSIQDDVGDLMDDLAAEAEGVRDRVWRQQRRRSRARRQRDGDADVEAEFRRDEAAEADDAGRVAPPEAPAEPEAEEAPPIPPASQLFPDVLGWQPLVLNRDLACGRCGLDLRAGESAFLGMAAGGLTETALCGPCASGSTGRRGR